MASQKYSPYSGDSPPTVATNLTDYEEYYYSDNATPRPTVAMWVDTLLDQIQGYMHLYIPPILLCIGLFGNLTALAVLRQKSMMKSSTIFYMWTLVIANLVALTVGCAADWIASVSNLKPLQIISDSSCRIWYFLLGLILNYPTWLVTAMCIDRFICVWHARSSANKCTSFRAKVICIFIFIGLVCVCIHALWSYALYDKVRVTCQHGVRNHYFHIIIWPWIQAALCSYIPLLLILVFSPLLLVGTIKNGHLIRVLPDMNKTVLLISVTYFLLATPAAITNLVEYFLPMSYRQQNSVRAATMLARAVSQIALFSNYCLTFVWLLVSSRSFRKELFSIVGMIGRCCLRKGMQEIPQTEMNGDGKNKIEIEEHDIGTQL